MKNRFIIFVIASVFAACSGGEKGNDKKAELENLKKQQSDLKDKIMKLESELSVKDSSAEKAKLVGITEMKQDTFTHYIEVQGKVEGDQDVLLSAETGGNITSLSVKPGDKVSAGQVLAVIEDKMVKQSIAEMQSQLDLTTQLFNRQKNLWDQKIGSEVQFLQAKTNKDAMERRMDAMQQQLDMTRIKSPINGVVDEVDIKIGQTMAPGMPAIRVVNFKSLKVKGEIAESFISRVSKGNDVVLFFPDEKKELKTRIDYSGGRIDPVNRTFNVEVRLTDKQGEFHPNMIVVMKIADYNNKSAYVLPVGAVQKNGDGEFVYVVTNEGNKIVAKRKDVVSGMIYNGYAEIKSGLADGDKVITNGFQNVIEGDPVTI